MIIIIAKRICLFVEICYCTDKKKNTNRIVHAYLFASTLKLLPDLINGGIRHKSRGGNLRVSTVLFENDNVNNYECYRIMVIIL